MWYLYRQSLQIYLNQFYYSIKSTFEHNLFLHPTLIKTLSDFKKGKFEYKADKTGVVHVSFGKAEFTDLQLIENLQALYQSIEQNRPSGVKGKYFKNLYISTTMGPSIQLDLDIFS